MCMNTAICGGIKFQLELGLYDVMLFFDNTEK